MNWKHGYYADSGYTYGYYVETSPLRLAWAALIQGQQLPTRGFRYLDAGCGQGLSLILMAAAHPDSEFVGVDFLPEHIAHANDLAQSCGLRNVRFIEGDFIELEKDPSALGQFDYAVSHGITSWIAPAVKRALFSLIGRVLRPGGIFYNSYNTFPGWLAAVPFQHLVLLEQRSKTGALALKAARESMAALKEGAPALFGNLPGLGGRLESMEKLDPAYLVQEYNNQYWQPLFVNQMMDDMAAVKLGYLGTATLPEAFESSYTPKVRELLQAQATPETRELLRDFAVNQSFRRDLYVKGRSRPWAAQQMSLLRAFRFVANPVQPRPEEGKPYPIKAGGIELSGKPEYYSALLERIQKHADGITVGELIEGSGDAQQPGNTLQALSMLLHGGWCLLHQTGIDSKAGRSANAALAQAVCDGAPYRYLSLPRAGAALSISDVEWFFVAAALDGHQEAAWPEAAQQNLRRLNRSLLKEGKPVTDAAEQLEQLRALASSFSQSKQAFLKRMGAL